jgi:hypothetical protein
VLGRQGLEHGRLGVPAQRAEPPDVAGEQVVADDAPVLGPVDPDDVVVVQVQQGRPSPGFAVAPVEGSLGPDHVERHAQRDRPVGRPAASGDLAVGVLDGDLVAEVPCRPGAGVGDQRLLAAEFQLEFVAQEPGQLVLDVLGFGLRPGEPQEVVVGVARVAQPPVPGVVRVSEGEGAYLPLVLPGLGPVALPAGLRKPVVRLSVLGVSFPAFPSGILRYDNCLGKGVQLAEVNIGENW